MDSSTVVSGTDKGQPGRGHQAGHILRGKVLIRLHSTVTGIAMAWNELGVGFASSS
jgi:hypothetical protein